jgi:hypothetical protein
VLGPDAAPFEDGRGPMLAVAGAAPVSGTGAAVGGPGLFARAAAEGSATPSFAFDADTGALLGALATTGRGAGAGSCGGGATVGAGSSIVETAGLGLGVDSTGRGGSTTGAGAGMTARFGGGGGGAIFGGGAGSGLTGWGSAATSSIGMTARERADQVRLIVNASQSRPACKSDDETIGTTHDESGCRVMISMIGNFGAGSSLHGRRFGINRDTATRSMPEPIPAEP